MRALFLTLLAFLATPAFGQHTGNVVGTVQSQTGEPLIGATVIVDQTSLGTATDAQGRFSLDGIPAGRHVIIARFVGYEPASRVVQVVPGETRQLDFRLGEGAASLDQVVVTATRSERALIDVPASVSVITMRDVERRGAVYSGQELVGIPGVSFESSYEGTYASVQIRGVPSNHNNDTFVGLIDGVPFVTNGDEVDLERMLPLPVIERVEVVRGPMSALYGRGGVSGAINYITRNAFTAPKVEARIDGGSYGYFRPQLGAAVPISANNRLLAHGFYERKDGWREGSQREAANVFLKNQWAFTERTALSSYVNFNTSSQHFASHLPVRPDGSLVSLPGGAGANYQIEDPNDHRRFGAATFILDHRLSSAATLRLTAQARDMLFRTSIGFNEQFDEQAGIFHWNGYSAESNYTVFYAEPQVTWEVGQIRLVAGASAERIHGTSETFWTGEHGFTPGVGFLFYTQRRDAATGEFIGRNNWVTDQRLDATYTNTVLGTYAQLEWSPVDQVTATIGGRFDSFERDVDFDEVAPRGTPIPAVHAVERNQRLSPKASLLYRWNPRWSSYVSYGEGFAPAFGLMSGFRSRDEGLLPETARSFEVGTKGSVLNDLLVFSAAVYRLDRENLIVQSFGQGEDRIRFTNAGGQYSQGFELESQFDFEPVFSGLSAYFSYAFTESKWSDYRFVDGFSEQAYDFSDMRVAGVSPHQLTARLGQRLAGGVRVGAWYDFRSDYWLDRPNTLNGGGYGLLGANISWAPRQMPGIELSLTGTNLLDTTYFSYYSTNDGVSAAYPGRPREVLATLHYRF